MEQFLDATALVAAHLRHAQADLTAQWVQRILADDQIEHSNDLPRSELIDHVPIIYDELCSAIELGDKEVPEEQKLARTAKLHGYYRWAQGYRLDELVRELDTLRRVILGAAQSFCATEHFEIAIVLKTVSIIDTLFAEVSIASVRQHMTEHELQVRASFEERDRADQALRLADRRKNEFLAMLGHELRNPLAPIRSAVSVLQSAQAHLPDATNRAVQIIDRQSAQLQRLVNELLDVARLTGGLITLRAVPTNLVDVLLQAVEQARPLIDAKAQSFALHLPSEAVYVNGDAGRLTQVFGNLLNNAVKYTDAKGGITLSLTVFESKARVVVQDFGMGIMPEMLEAIFELFTQTPRALDRAEGGLGVGLTLARKIAELHGGTISASSAGADQGSEFTVELPVIAAGSQTAEKPVFVVSAVPRRVLIVDDNEDAAAPMAALVEMSGHVVSTTHDGAAVLNDALIFKPDVILLDIGLPGKNGLEVCKELRAHPQFRDTVIIALTGYGQPEDRERTADAGFNGHLVKPVDMNELLGSIDGH